MNSTSPRQKAQPSDSFDLTRRERAQCRGKWVIVDYGGRADHRSAADTENEAWERFLEQTTAPKARFVEDGFKAVQDAMSDSIPYRPPKFKSLAGAVRRIRELKRMVKERDDLLERWNCERKLLARLCADIPQFSNPLEVAAARRVRDEILQGQ